MNGKLLILMVSVSATIGLSGCTSLNCPAEFARPKSRELTCGTSGDVMSTGSEVYITPAQYQELRRRSTNMYVPPDAPTNLQQPSVAPLAPMPSSQIPSSPAAGASTGMIEG